MTHSISIKVLNAECRIFYTVLLTVVMLIVVTLTIVMLSVVTSKAAMAGNQNIFLKKKLEADEPSYYPPFKQTTKQHLELWQKREMMTLLVKFIKGLKKN